MLRRTTTRKTTDKSNLYYVIYKLDQDKGFIVANDTKSRFLRSTSEVVG